MSYTWNERFTLYRLEAVQRELGIDLLTWTKLLAGYELKPKTTTYKGYTGMTLEEKIELSRNCGRGLSNLDCRTA